MEPSPPVPQAALEFLLLRSTASGDNCSTWAAVIPSPIGALVAAATDDGLCLLEFGELNRLARQLEALSRLFGPVGARNHPMLDRARRELEEYFDGRRTRFEVPLVIRGTPFQELIWNALL